MCQVLYYVLLYNFYLSLIKPSYSKLKRKKSELKLKNFNKKQKI